MLNFLGIGSAFAINNKNTSTYFIKENTFFLFDCGESVFTELVRKNDFQNLKK